MKQSNYRQWTNKATDWIEGYFKTLRDRPVRAQTSPGDIAALLPSAPPEQSEDMNAIIDDFARIVPGGMTHWQHPRFFAYFAANAAPASLIADQLANAIGAQCMLWQTSPAATEMETVMVDWLRQSLGLAESFKGVIQDSGSSSTLSAILTMRERGQNFEGNQKGYAGSQIQRIYCSSEVHSSVDKACWIAGIGQENLIKIPTNDQHQMRPEALQAAIDADRKAGFLPSGLVMCTGGTTIGASDHLPLLLDIAEAENLYTHLDAAWAGSAMICPELRDIWEGSDRCDSIVFNPHKWLGAQFDCSIQFLKDPTAQIRTLGIKPSYLETQGQTDIINYSEWTVPLGRRFRALKLWFLIRAYGLEGLRSRIRSHIAWIKEVEAMFDADPDFVIHTPSMFSLFTMQYTPSGEDPDIATKALIERINNDGRIYLTQAVHQGKFVIRITAGQFDCTKDDVLAIYDVIKDLAAAT